MSTGIDISAHQTGFDYKAAAKEIDFVILRSNWGTNEDSMLQTHAAGFKAAGVPITGLYCFDYALNVDQVRSEADCIIELAKSLGLSKDTVLWFDCEGDSVRWANDNGVNLDAATVQKHTREFMNRVKAAGYKTGYYSNLDWMLNRYKGFRLEPDEKFWFARYDHEPEYDADVLQHTSSGRIAGYDGPLDMNTAKEETVNMALKKINPAEWINSHKGKIYDIDGVFGIQCVDLFKIFLKEIGFPNPTQPLGGSGYADEIWYQRSKYANYFTFHTGELKPGDIVLWAKGAAECPDSHVAMFVKDDPANPSRGIFLGSNQGYTHSNGNMVSISLSGSLGHLRYKGYTTESTAAEKTGVLIEEHRIAKVKDGHNINLRLGGPNGRIVGQIGAGEKFEYTHKIVTNGHRYVVAGNLYLAVTPTENRADYWTDILPV